MSIRHRRHLLVCWVCCSLNHVCKTAYVIPHAPIHVLQLAYARICKHKQRLRLPVNTRLQTRRGQFTPQQAHQTQHALLARLHNMYNQYVCVYIYIYTHTYTYAYMYTIDVYIHMYVCIYVYIYIYIYTLRATPTVMDGRTERPTDRRL